jgi:NADH-quinone oxidoreductase subunit H
LQFEGASTVNFVSAWTTSLFWAQETASAAVASNASLWWNQWLWWGGWLVAFFGVFPGIVAYMVWAERKVAARFQDRIGPNRVGPLGLLQPIADAIKLITKENIVPRTADQWVHIIAPVVLLISAFLVLAVVPFGFGLIDPETGRLTGLMAANLPAGLLYLIAVSSMSSLGIFLAGWSSRNKYSLLGAMRAVAQLVSYEIPQVLSTVPIILWTGSLSLANIVNQQIDTGYWYIFSPPGLLAFGLLTIANIAEVNRTPFDLPEAESEIIAGYHTEYSGMRFGLFFLAEYLSVFGVSCLGTVLFLGGGSLPFTSFPRNMLSDTTLSILLVNAITVGVFFAKVFGYVFLMFWIRATLPRLRVDQLMNFAWKTMIPLSILNIIYGAIWYEMVIRHPAHNVWQLWILRLDLTWLAGTVVTLPLIVISIWGLVKVTAMTSEVLPTSGRKVMRRTVAAR